MKKVSVRLLVFALLISLAVSLTACFDMDDFSLETTTISTTTPYKRKSFDASMYPYFGTLSEKGKDIYSQLYEEIYSGNKSFECKVSCTAEDLTKAIDAVMNDHPEFFWLDNKYAYTYDPVDGSIKEVTLEFYDFAETPEKLHSAKVKFEQASDAVIDQARLKPTVVERELYIHNYICQYTSYDEAAPYNQSAYSVLVEHRSVCAGYSRAFQYLMNKLSITCYYVTGRTDGLEGGVANVTGEGGSHSWNIVLIEGQYYNVDCLWNDTASDTYGSPIYPFFNLTDGEFVYHARVDMAVKLPRCNGTKFKYSNVFGQTVEAESIVFENAA